MAKVISESQVTVPVGEMKCGQVAIITACGQEVHIGKVVQRYDKHLICLGEYSAACWSNMFNSPSESMKVRILPKGTLIEL